VFRIEQAFFFAKPKTRCAVNQALALCRKALSAFGTTAGDYVTATFGGHAGAVTMCSSTF